MNEQYTLAIDLDGVIADFSKKVGEINGMPFNKVPRGQLWKSIERYDRDVEPFFESLDLMPDAMKLWEYASSNFINLFILTACGFTPRNAAEQKRRWVAKHFGKAVVCKVVTDSHQKAQFANPRTILVDDRMKSIGPWSAAGGIPVLHTSAADSIAKLKEIVQDGTV